MFIVTTAQTRKIEARLPGPIRIVASVLVIAGCLGLIFFSATIGFSRLLGRYGVLSTSLPATNEALRLAPSDPEAHRAQAAVFRNLKMYREAAKELEVAISLRPSDDYLWLELGVVRDELEDPQGALRAFDRAVAQAPYYAHTRWQRANVRLRVGRYEEAFAELRAAATSNRGYLLTLIDLAWSLSKGDAKVTEQLAGINDTADRIAFARFLARKGKGKETVEQFRLVKSQISEEYKRELIRELVYFGAYPEAYEIWSGTEPHQTVVMYDGGFEGTINFGEDGFGWNFPRDLSKVKVSVDTSDKDSGEKSIRIVFDGNSNAGAAVFSQLLIVNPKQQYRINFASKGKEIVSGGLPLLSVANAQTNVTFASSSTLPQNSTSWEKRSIDFTTPDACHAIVLKLVRTGCQSNPCPVFGVLWLDSFSIEEIHD